MILNVIVSPATGPGELSLSKKWGERNWKMTVLWGAFSGPFFYKPAALARGGCKKGDGPSYPLCTHLLLLFTPISTQIPVFNSLVSNYNGGKENNFLPPDTCRWKKKYISRCIDGNFHFQLHLFTYVPNKPNETNISWSVEMSYQNNKKHEPRHTRHIKTVSLHLYFQKVSHKKRHLFSLIFKNIECFFTRITASYFFHWFLNSLNVFLLG